MFSSDWYVSLTIQFNLFVCTHLNVKTVLFQEIQFSIIHFSVKEHVLKCQTVLFDS